MYAYERYYIEHRAERVRGKVELTILYFSYSSHCKVSNILCFTMQYK